MSDKPLAIVLADDLQRQLRSSRANEKAFDRTILLALGLDVGEAIEAELRRLAAVEAWYKLLAGYMVLGLLVCNWDGECIEITTGNKVSGTKQYTFNCEFDDDGLPVESEALRKKLEELL